MKHHHTSVRQGWEVTQTTDRQTNFQGYYGYLLHWPPAQAPGKQAGSPLSHNGEKQSSEIPLPLALKCGTEMSRKGDRLKSHHT